MLVSISELKTNPGKYVEIANNEVVYITKNGKKVAMITGTETDKPHNTYKKMDKKEKVAAIKKLFGILSPDVDLEQARLERIRARALCHDD